MIQDSQKHDAGSHQLRLMDAWWRLLTKEQARVHYGVQWCTWESVVYLFLHPDSEVLHLTALFASCVASTKPIVMLTGRACCYHMQLSPCTPPGWTRSTCTAKGQPAKESTGACLDAVISLTKPVEQLACWEYLYFFISQVISEINKKAFHSGRVTQRTLRSWWVTNDPVCQGSGHYRCLEITSFEGFHHCREYGAGICH